MEPVAHYGIRKNEKDIKNQIKRTNGKTKRIGFLKNPSVFPNSVIVTDFRPEGQGFKESITQFIDNLSGTITFITTTLTSILIATKL